MINNLETHIIAYRNFDKMNVAFLGSDNSSFCVMIYLMNR